METLPQQVVNGLSMGSLYALLALGLTMILGLMNVFQFAHGEIVTLGAFAAYYVTQLGHLPWPLALTVSVVVGAACGWVMYRGFFLRFANDEFSGVLVAFGLSTIIQGVAFYFWRGVPRYSTPPFSEVLDLGGVRLAYQRILIFAVVIAAFALLHYILRRTKFGKGTRALAQNATAAALMGISPRGTFTAVFVLGSALGGLAGALLASLMPIDPFFGGSVLMKGFVVVVLGGMGYVPGALAGGLILGLGEALGSAYFSAPFQDGYGFLILILVLLARPRGIFGIRERLA